VDIVSRTTPIQRNNSMKGILIGIQLTDSRRDKPLSVNSSSWIDWWWRVVKRYDTTPVQHFYQNAALISQ